MNLIATVLAFFVVGVFAWPSAACAADVSGPARPTLGGFDLSLSVLGAVGGSSANDRELEFLQAGGHDPGRNGFNLQNVELTLAGTVDRYFDAQANIIFLIDRHGDSVVELEEAFLATRALPAGLQLKAGYFYTEFGRHNPQHPHSWVFVDQPVVLSRFLGPDGLRNPGARLSWLMPLPWYSEWYLGAQDAGGETAVSFLWEPGESVGGNVLIDRGGARGLTDLLRSARWLNGFDVSDTVSVNLGLSALAGPNASGDDTDTRIYGVDVYLKWKPLLNQRGFPFLAWQTELLRRDYQIPAGTLKDGGGYSQLLWGYAPGWVAGARAEYADAKGETEDDPLRDRRTRASANLTWHMSEYSKLRLQYNHDRAEQLADGRAHSLWLQYEVGFGKHAAHLF